MLSIERHNDHLRIEAPAKINLGLRLLGRRDDGYHEIESLVMAVSLTDTLEARSAGDASLTLDVQADPASAPADESNLVLRAARLLQQTTGTDKGARITLCKRIPAGRGLGGGSSDAAATLVMLNDLWGLRLDNDRLEDLAAELGSDVPFFLGSPLSVMRGRGEVLEALDDEAEVGVLLVVPPFPLATKDVYQRWVPPLTTGSGGAKLWLALLRDGMLEDLGRCLVNDLEAPARALRSELLELRQALETVGAPCVSMTGSGSAMYALVADCQAARRMAQHLRVSADTDVCVLAPWNSVRRSAN
ncbi:MAG: 4-(cytidine 5'-diphospho)-2-C-methyl-D-erythritol kinase [Anaerolineaceae bacterium]|nr:4-(cytidine 5'-diphospho)-2-C-methyl-D-erythritol kinase [Anaerolineaceae bacterium]